MEQYLLYLVIKEIINNIDSSYKCSFNDFNLSGDNIAAIRVKGAEPVEYRAVGTGEYYGYNCRLQILLQGGLTHSSLLSLLSLASNIRNTLITTYNTKYTNIPVSGNIAKITVTGGNKLDIADVGLVLNKVGLLGETDFKGKDSQGRPQYSLNFKINYALYNKNKQEVS